MKRGFPVVFAILFTALGLLTAPACDKSKELMAAAAPITKMAQEYLPKVTGLKEQLAGLTAKVSAMKDLPVIGEKAAAVMGKLEGFSKTVEGFASKFSPDSVKGAIDSAVKSGKKEDIAKLQGDYQAAVTQVESITKELPTLEADVKTLETEVEAAKAAAATAMPNLTWMEKLSTGFELKGSDTGVEKQLIAFIKDEGKKVDKTTWFDFDRLAFTQGKADLDMTASKDQLSNLAEILKAYPAVKLKVGGYTDSVGDAAANQKLSAERAESVKKELVALGVDAGRLEAEGYGDKEPVAGCKNGKDETPECAAKNRRTSVRVTSK